MSGYVDFEQEYNLTTHLTSIGNRQVAEILAENLGPRLWPPGGGAANP